MNIIVLILVLAVFGALLNIANRRLSFLGKKVYLVVGCYLIILLVGTALHFLILEKEISQAEKINEDSIPLLDQVSHGERAIETIESYLVEEYTFDYQNDELTLYAYEPDYTYVPVLIERTVNDGSNIKVNVYQVPVLIEGVVVTGQMDIMSAELYEDELYFHLDGFADINLNVYKNDFPMRQFTGETLFNEDSPFFGRPNQLIHVRIPEQIKLIIDDDVNIYYLNE